MGYLNNNIITVDAILTKKGRETLAKNDGSFRITQFALGDDEIDYTLYNVNHPSGSAYYGQAIDGMPLLDLGFSAITLQQGAQLAVTPQTLNYLGNDQIFETSGYVATIADVRTMATYEGVGISSAAATAQNSTSTTTLGTNVSSTVIGTQINLRATTINTLFGSNSTLLTTLTVIGLDSGARATVPVTITKVATT